MQKKISRYLIAFVVFSVVIGLYFKDREKGTPSIDRQPKDEQTQSVHAAIVNAISTAASSKDFAQEMEKIFLAQIESRYQINMSAIAVSEYLEQFGGEALTEASYNSDQRNIKNLYDSVQSVKDGEDANTVYRRLVASHVKIPKKAWKDIVDELSPGIEEAILEHATRSYEMYKNDLIASVRPLYRLNTIATKICADKKITRKLTEADYIKINRNFFQCQMFANREVIRQIVSVRIEVPRNLKGWKVYLNPFRIRKHPEKHRDIHPKNTGTSIQQNNWTKQLDTQSNLPRKTGTFGLSQ